MSDANRALSWLALAVTIAMGCDSSADVFDEPEPDASRDAGGDADAALDGDVSDGGGLVCEARAITVGVRHAGTLAGANEIDGASCGEAAGPDGAFLVEVAEPSVLIADVMMPGAVDVVLSVRRACDDPGSELGCAYDDDDEGRVGAQLAVAVDPGTYVIVVDTSGSEDAPFTLDTSLGPVSGCSASTDVTVGTARVDEMPPDGTETSACFIDMIDRGISWYRVTVPADSLLVVDAHDAVGPLQVAFATDCGPPVICGTEHTGLGAYPNASMSPREVYVAVATERSTLFDVSFDAVAFPDNAECMDATVVSGGSFLRGVPSEIGGPPSACSSRGSERWYEVTVPAGERLDVFAYAPADGERPPQFRLTGDCDGTCLGGAALESGLDRSHAGWENTTVADATVWFATTGGVGPHDLAVASFGAQGNTTCADAVSVGGDALIPLEDLDSGTGDLSSACVPGTSAGSLFYAVTVPPGEQLFAAAPGATLRLLDACDATECRTYGSNALVWENHGASEETMILAIAGSGEVDVEISTGLGFYMVEEIASACADLSAEPPLTDPPFSTMAPPFPFQLFGQPVTSYSMHFNGWLGPPGFGGGNNPPLAPGDFTIAAFYDQTRFGFPVPFERRVAERTEDGRHVVLEWANLELYPALPGSRLTVQAKLFESGVVELHYCSLTPDDPLTRGASATIGLAGDSGPVGALGAAGGASPYSFNEPSVATGVGIRFTPR